MSTAKQRMASPRASSSRDHAALVRPREYAGGSCLVCNCVVPNNAWQQHRRGKRHQALRFYGNASASVGDVIPQYAVDVQANGPAPVRIRSHEVPERIVAAYLADPLMREVFAAAGWPRERSGYPTA